MPFERISSEYVRDKIHCLARDMEVGMKAHHEQLTNISYKACAVNYCVTDNESPVSMNP